MRKVSEVLHKLNKKNLLLSGRGFIGFCRNLLIMFVVVLLAVLLIMSVSTVLPNMYLVKDIPSIDIDTRHGEVPAEGDRIVVGFSQLGAESDWRSHNTDSILSALSEENGFELIYENGQQKQSNQITAIRSFIQQDVDYIVLAPVVETGWDTVLQEAREAGIPVILIDRDIETEDKSLVTCRVGNDFALEGRKVCEWLDEFVKSRDIAPYDVHIINVQGTVGASAQIGRTRGLEIAAAHHGWDLVAESSGDFTQAKGREVAAELLKIHPETNVIYCENDNMALGVVEAVEAAGRRTGYDIENGEVLILSFDGVMRQTMEMVADGRIGCIAQCNPDQGPRLMRVIRDLENGVNPDRYTYVNEEIYSGYTGINWLMLGGKNYQVTYVTGSMVDFDGRWDAE